MVFALDGMPLFEKQTNSSNYFKYIIKDEYFIGEASNGNLEKLLKAFKTIVTKNEKKDGYIDEFYKMKEYTKLQKKIVRGLVWSY